ncbi:hypothetical protein [Scytonema sp. NUACC26]|uniref:two-partner secretion domain-containing protein n=1 Tax=Scytonema sp. NUACC26 TaxID=3140176 RepID=UPI0034DCB534
MACCTASPTTPLLSISVPIGLQYGTNPQPISHQSQARTIFGESVGLQVQEGKTLALVGGDVRLNGGILTASGGQVELGGLAEPGMVGLSLDGDGLSLSFFCGTDWNISAPYWQRYIGSKSINECCQ